MEAEILESIFSGSTPLAVVLAWFMFRAEKRTEDLIKEVSKVSWILQTLVTQKYHIDPNQAS